MSRPTNESIARAVLLELLPDEDQIGDTFHAMTSASDGGQFAGVDGIDEDAVINEIDRLRAAIVTLLGGY